MLDILYDIDCSLVAAYLRLVFIIGLIETKLFHFNRIFKNGGRRELGANPLNPLWIRTVLEQPFFEHLIF